MPLLHGETVATVQFAQEVMDDVRRAREFYQYLQPDNLLLPHLRRRESTFDGDHEHVPSLSAALAPYCQLAVVRCNAMKAMVNVMDRDIMYFLAETTRRRSPSGSEELYEFVEDPILLSCSSVPLKGRICEMTIKLDPSESATGLSLFVIPDLLQSQFADLGVVAGPPHYRFYAGVPIKTRDDIVIGSLAVMDTEPRQAGLTRAEEEFLGTTARQIMMFLETNRQAIEGRRSRRMAKGLECFIAGNKSIDDNVEGAQERRERKKGRATYAIEPLAVGHELREGDLSMSKVRERHSHRNNSIISVDSEVDTSEPSTDIDDQKQQLGLEGETRSHSQAFARAANLLRECMGNLGDEGGVSFQSLKTEYGGQVGRFKATRTDSTLANGEKFESHGANPGPSIDVQQNSTAARILACSTQSVPFGTCDGADPRCLPSLNAKLLQDLTDRYPSGRLWSLDDIATSSSEGESATSQAVPVIEPRIRKSSRRKQIELTALRAAFPSARQILFAPMWDPTIGSFAHACFVISALETRSLSATFELSFLTSFCSTIMAECSRLDTMMADKQKSDFVGTISHEMRSPLHGILASVEFLADTDMSEFQRSLIDTVDSCGRTLLDTINHVLDFSKVNSFQKQWQSANKRSAHGVRRNPYLGPENSARSIAHGAPPLLQLFGVTNIAAVLEEVVEGLVLGHTYKSGIEITDVSREARGRGNNQIGSRSVPYPADPVDIIINVERAEWEFMTQPGAIRRIIMNITGNAIKYTTRGSIEVSLTLRESKDALHEGPMMVFTVTDTGKGISADFLATRLFVPFAQENALAPGTGLGLSIVRSIVLMLGGTIDVNSVVGKGTTIEVVLPLKRPLPGQVSSQNTPQSGGTNATVGSGSDESIVLLQNQASDATVTFYRQRSVVSDKQCAALQNYIRDWYHLEFVDQTLIESASVVIVEEEDLEKLMDKTVSTPGQRPVLVVLCSVASRHSAGLIRSLEERISSPVEFLAKPCGPHKLARSIRLALEKKRAIKPRFPQVTNLGVIPEAVTPLPSAPILAQDGQHNLQEMDLNGPGANDSAKIVQATETFAASQTSQHAQMAITDPRPSMSTPASQITEGGAFPFPVQDDESSRKRRESNRSISFTNDQQGKTRMPPSVIENGAAPSVVPIAPLPQISPHVLLVDDNKINLRLLETFLRNKRKYTRVVKAEDGQQAVNAVTQAKEQFDIIFMDISMPVMNGFEATRAIREFEESRNTRPGAMVIALTGLASGRDQSEGFDSGCDIYMTKPVSFKEVGKLLNNWEEHQKINMVSEVVQHVSDRDRDRASVVNAISGLHL